MPSCVVVDSFGSQMKTISSFDEEDDALLVLGPLSEEEHPGKAPAIAAPIEGGRSHGDELPTVQRATGLVFSPLPLFNSFHINIICAYPIVDMRAYCIVRIAYVYYYAMHIFYAVCLMYLIG